MSASAPGGRPVVVVTGGGGGIGAAIATELGRHGSFVVTMDPLVSLDGTEQLPAPEETTAGRIVAAGGAARATSVSVTDGPAVRELLQALVAEHGRLDAVVNVAGITRPTSFARGTDDDWRDVLEVHLGGYLNVLDATLPIMAAAGHGRVLGVTSGSGWRAADAGAYSCAKRAVAALTWELGRCAPPGVAVNAMSPIAVTRMVTAALARAGGPGDGRKAAAERTGSTATGGLALGSMPEPDDLGPLGAHLVSDQVAWCNGQVIFAGGSEVALVEPPRFLEVVGADAARSLAHVLDAVTAGALVPAETQQTSTGGSNPRFTSVFDEPDGDLSAVVASTCAVVTDRPELGAVVTAALEARGVRCTTVPAEQVATGFEGRASALASAAEREGPLDAVVVAVAGSPPSAGEASAWERVLADHAGIVDQIHADAGWARAAVDLAAGTDRPLRLVTLTDARTPGGRSRGQAAAQLARAARKATGDRVSAFSVSLEAAGPRAQRPAGELVAALICGADTATLSGAELAVGTGWVGLRSHPRPAASLTLGGPAVPDWFDDVLRAVVGVPTDREEVRS